MRAKVTVIEDAQPVVAAVRAQLAGGRFLVAVGQYSGVEGAERVTIVTWAGEEAWDGFVRREAIAGLREALRALGAGGAGGAAGSVRAGEIDTMHATGWSYAWTTDGAPFVLLDAEGPLVEVDAGRVRVRGRAPLAAGEVAGVAGRLSRDWTERWVELVLGDGARVEVARQVDKFPLVDPTYDGLNLMADTAWVHGLVRPLGQALGVAVVLDEDLR